MPERLQSIQRRIREHLDRSLRTIKEGDRKEIEAALLRAADRYDRYMSSEDEWKEYAQRAAKLDGIRDHAREAAKGIGSLDIISREDFEARLGRERLATIKFDLERLALEADRLAKEVQRRGAPKNLAEERWIWEVADIFENALGKEAKVWGPGSGRRKNKGPFYELLEVCRPNFFPRYGKLHSKQVRTVLKRRPKKSRPKLVI